MKEASPSTYEFILRQCAAVDPQPWYPSAYVPADGISRADLDRALDDLRLGGLVRLTEWVPGQGQGYALTPEGGRVVASPGVLAKLRAWKPSRALEAERPRAERSGEQGVTPLERGDAVRNALTDPSPPWVTWILILLNIAVFVAGLSLAVNQNADVNQFLSRGDSRILDQTGAYNGLKFVNGRWWLLISTCFVHAGLLHIGCNMLALYSFGRLVEQMFGWRGYLVLYLISGVGGSIGGVIREPMVGCVGASGAICGIVGAAVSWVWLNRGFLPPAFVGQLFRAFRNAAIFIVFFSLLPGVSAAGHFGGAVTGLAAGALLTELRFGRVLRQVLAVLGFLVLGGACASAIPVAQSVDARWNDLFIQREGTRWNQQYREKIEALWDSSQHDWEDAKAGLIRRQPGDEPDKESIAKALSSLSNAKQKLQEALALIEKAGPFHDDTMELRRLRMVEQIQQREKAVDRFEKEFHAASHNGSK
jgi:rhomboid protease GluP